MKRLLILAAILIGLAVSAQAQRTPVYFGLGGNPVPPAAVYRPAYPIVNPAYPVYPVARPWCGPYCRHERRDWRRWERREWRQHERREHWRRDLCRRGYRRYCGW